MDNVDYIDNTAKMFAKGTMNAIKQAATRLDPNAYHLLALERSAVQGDLVEMCTRVHI